MDVPALVNVVKTDCYLQETVHESFRVEVFILVFEETFGYEVS